MLTSRKAQTITEFAILGSLIIVAFAFLINYSEKINRQQFYLQENFKKALAEAKNANNTASYTKVVFNRMPNVSNPMELGQVQSFNNSANILWSDGRESRDKDGRDILGVAKYEFNEEVVNIPQRATLNNLIIDLEQTPDPQGTIAPIITDLRDIGKTLGEPNPDYEEQKENFDQAISSLTGISGINSNIISGLQEMADSLPIPGQAQSSANTFTNKVDSTTIFTKSEIPPGVITTTKTLTAKDTLTANVTIGSNPQTLIHYLGKGGKYYPDETKLERTRTNNQEQ